MGSTDQSRQIALKYHAKVYHHQPLEFVEPARNYGIRQSHCHWVLLLDPDEFLGKTLKTELKLITQRSDIDYVKIPRKNIVFSKWIRHTGFWPDYLVRFFRPKVVIWQDKIHSQPITTGRGLTLLVSEKLAIRHRHYSSISDYLIRSIRYSSIQASELEQAGYKLKISDFILKPIQEFNSRFFANEGYKDGLHGLIISILQAFAESFIYLQLWEKRGFKEKTLSKESFVSASQEATFEFHHWFTRYFIHEYSNNIFKNFMIKVRYFLDRLTKNF
jgi:(heptosyl)LPS beta-1,4-glucosyltransferase